MISGSNNPFPCDPVVFANANTIISLGTITRTGNQFTFSTGFVWKINGVIYQNTSPVIITISEASDGFDRIDNALLNTSNSIELQQGLESDVIALQPLAPDTNIILTSWFISGNSVSNNTSTTTNVSPYKGAWDANSNYPFIVDGVGRKGDYFLVSVEGTYNGVLYKEGDRIEYNSEVWYKSVNNNQSGGSGSNPYKQIFSYTSGAQNFTLPAGAKPLVVFLNRTPIADWSFSGTTLTVSNSITLVADDEILINGIQ